MVKHSMPYQFLYLLRKSFTIKLFFYVLYAQLNDVCLFFSLKYYNRMVNIAIILLSIKIDLLFTVRAVICNVY